MVSTLKASVKSALVSASFAFKFSVIAIFAGYVVLLPLLILTARFCANRTGVFSDGHILICDFIVAVSGGISAAVWSTPGIVAADRAEREAKIAERQRKVDDARFWASYQRQHDKAGEVIGRFLVGIGALVLFAIATVLIFILAPMVYAFVASLPVGVAIMAGAIIIAAAILMLAA